VNIESIERARVLPDSFFRRRICVGSRRTAEETRKLVEAGFEYVTDVDSAIVFKKRK
jgi:hypothetical protein